MSLQRTSIRIDDIRGKTNIRPFFIFFILREGAVFFARTCSKKVPQNPEP
jgi:hypothetical protein